MKNDATWHSGRIYNQVVSAGLVLVMTGFGIAGLWGLVGLAWPSLTVESSTFREYRTRAEFFQENYVKREGRYYRLLGNDPTGMTVDDATEVWRDARAEALANERRGSGRQVALALIAFIVCLPLYLYHHRLGRRAEKDEG